MYPYIDVNILKAADTFLLFKIVILQLQNL